MVPFVSPTKNQEPLLSLMHSAAGFLLLWLTGLAPASADLAPDLDDLAFPVITATAPSWQSFATDPDDDDPIEACELDLGAPPSRPAAPCCIAPRRGFTRTVGRQRSRSPPFGS